MPQSPVFDGHNDVLLRLWTGGPVAVDGFAGGGAGHIDREKAAKGGFAGGFFAIFVPSKRKTDYDAMENPPYDLPLPEPIPQEEAWDVTMAQAEILAELDRRGDVAQCRTADDIETAIDTGKIAAVLHLEGAEAIGPELAELDTLYDMGLRSIGPVWSRPTIFGHGVPFRHPSDGDTGPGLTEAGRRLVKAAYDKRMIVDTSHMTMKGFYDIADLGVPLVATHSNAHAVAPHARNLTDDQLRAIGETGGMVGLNFATAFLREDGVYLPSDALDWMVRHLDHLIGQAGEDHVGLGSDFDGATIPQEIGTAAGLDVLRERMVAAGYGEALIAKLCHENWIAAIGRLIG